MGDVVHMRFISPGTLGPAITPHGAADLFVGINTIRIDVNIGNIIRARSGNTAEPTHRRTFFSVGAGGIIHLHLASKDGSVFFYTGFNVNFRVTPHVLRHAKAMGMLKAGINLIYIRDFLGHSNITTTEIYARADSEMKRKALEKTYKDLYTGKMPEWEEDKDLMQWLHDLCR